MKEKGLLFYIITYNPDGYIYLEEWLNSTLVQCIEIGDLAPYRSI